MMESVVNGILNLAILIELHSYQAGFAAVKGKEEDESYLLERMRRRRRILACRHGIKTLSERLSHES